MARVQVFITARIFYHVCVNFELGLSNGRSLLGTSVRFEHK